MVDFSKFTDHKLTTMEAVTRIPAKAMLLQCELLPASNAVVLDSACGSGIVANILFGAIGNDSTGVRVECGDLTPPMVEFADKRIKLNNWNAEAKVMDAHAIPFPDDYFTHNTINMGIQLFKDGSLALNESFRVLKSGGILAFTTWVKPGWVDTVYAGVPGFTLPPVLTSDTWTSDKSLTELITTAGFKNILIKPCTFDITTNCPTFVRDLRSSMDPMLAGEKGEMYEAFMKKTYGDGDFTLTWEALVITASKP
ncbi:S-adenosyl-L-methionine-dependent methyltransferase [Mycena rebaudengoi]|nr:S-adenosyl-L-methionine-dependent methyltransferase [Mycena rebaudengoi]